MPPSYHTAPTGSHHTPVPYICLIAGVTRPLPMQVPEGGQHRRSGIAWPHTDPYVQAMSYGFSRACVHHTSARVVAVGRAYIIRVHV